MTNRQGFPKRGPAPELIAAAYVYESAGSAMLHRGLNHADMAHVIALHRLGIVPIDAAAALLTVLLEADDVNPADFGYDPADGEPYNSRERLFVQKIGDHAGWLHAGRPRREATRIAFRLFLRREVNHLIASATDLAAALADQAEANADTLFADHTYLQQAQPSTIGHYLISFAYPVLRDAQRLCDVIDWINSSPSGAGCVNGNRLTDDRLTVSDMLGFDQIIANTRDAMWQVDGLIQLASAAASLATTQTSLAEDLEIFASTEFDYANLADEYSRSSILMPQKHNPYALSMIRGATGVVIGHVTGLLAVQKSPSARSDSLIFAYGEVPLLLDQMERMTNLSRGVVETLSFNTERLRDELNGGFSQAADLAEQVMLCCNLDYRTAYRTVGAAVREVAASGRSAVDMTTADLDTAAIVTIGRPLGLQPAELASGLDPVAIVATRTAAGGAAAQPMQAMIADVRAQVASMRTQAKVRAHQFDTAEEAVRRLASDIAQVPASPDPGGSL
jgi:argininosuccinate lyase